MSAETVAAEQFFYARLSTDATMRGYAPGGFHSERQHAALPGAYVLWTAQGPQPDTTGEGGVRIYSTMVYLVRLVSQVQSFLPLQAGSDRLDQLLHLAPVMSTGSYTMRWCKRLRPYSLVEHFVDLEWRHLGGIYQVTIQP